MKIAYIFLLLLSFEASSCLRRGKAVLRRASLASSVGVPPAASGESVIASPTRSLVPIRTEHGFLRFPPLEDAAVMELYEAALFELRDTEHCQKLCEAMSAGTHRKIADGFVKAVMGYIWNEDRREPSQRLIPRNTFLWILAIASEAFSKETSCQEIRGGSEREVVIIGDTHGQIEDVFHILLDESICGMPSDKKAVVMNGDLVDRGEFGCEIVALLSALKSSETQIYAIRGNHESWRMTARFGFQEEVMAKYGDTEVLFMCQRLFQSLPLSAFVSVGGNPHVFISHGGIGLKTHDMTLAEIAQIDRFREPWEEQVAGLDENDVAREPDLSTVPLSELLWSDPVGGLEEEWAPNRSRGLPGGFLFGEGACNHFLKKNSLSYMVRSHQPPSLGFKGYWAGKCYTVFSASNYCGGNNQGAVLRLFKGGSNSVDPTFVQYCT